MSTTYLPPAGLKDFDRSADAASLYQHWHDLMRDYVTTGGSNFPAAYDALDPPLPGTPAEAAPEWTGLPRTVKRWFGPSVAAAAQQVEQAVEMGGFDPLVRGVFTSPFQDRTGLAFRGPAYRPQDEYLEWVSRRDADGVVTEIVFTAEGPEYWDALAADEKLLVEMYREICDTRAVELDHLLFPRDLFWDNPNETGGGRLYRRGTYNRFNRWNVAHAVHLTQPANTLGAEVALARQATLLYGTPPLTSDPELVCCAAYGGINRMSDPTIGAGVNTQVRDGRRVALRNPIGLYIRELQANAFTIDDEPFADQEACWEVLRPEPSRATDMIVRARFRVPPGLTHKGRQLRVGDLAYQGEAIAWGGQVADAVTMTLYALSLPGAPQQQPQACRFSPCADPRNPDFIVPVDFGQPCPQLPLMAALADAREDPPAERRSVAEALARLREAASQDAPRRAVRQP